MASSATSHVTMEHNITGPAFTVSSACSSSTHAIGQAFWMVRAGVADLALAGGSEACFTLGTLKAWESMRVMAPDTCRPFSRNRRGMVLGEGGAVVVLEPLDAARRRGAKIYAELAGMGMSSDAGHITLPCEHGAARAMRAALDDARMQPADIDYVNAHGTGTTANDSTESRAIRQVFGEHARALAVSSTKSMHGHALGASGAIELVATVLALHYGIVPPTANFTEPDPECDLDCVPNQARERPIRAALSNSFAFGGLNAVLAVRRFDPDAA
jgi:nodulation protein E